MTALTLAPAAFPLLEGFAWALPALASFSFAYAHYWLNKTKYKWAEDHPVLHA